MFIPELKQRIYSVIQILFDELKCKGEAIVDMGINNNYLVVKLLGNVVKKAQRIEDYHVPAFRFDTIDLSLLPWDFSFQHLIPQIDGVSNVKRIAREADMDILVAKRCLELLVFQGCIFVTDAVMFSNVYRLNQEVALQVFSDVELMDEIKAFSALEDSPNHTPSTHSLSPRPSSEQLISFFGKFHPGKKLRDIVLDAWDDAHSSESAGNRASASSQSLKSSSNSLRQKGKSSARSAASGLQFMGLNVIRAVVVGQAYGILQRLHEYPIYCGPAPSDSIALIRQLWSEVKISSLVAADAIDDEVKPDISPKRKSFAKERIRGCLKGKSEETLMGSLLDVEREKRKILTFNEGTKPGQSFHSHCFKTHSYFFLLVLSNSPPSFSRLNKSKSFHGNKINENTNEINLSGHGNLSDLILSLNGEHSLDFVCCKYGISPTDIGGLPDIRIIYK